MSERMRIHGILPHSMLEALVLLILVLGIAIIHNARQERATYYAHAERREVKAHVADVDERTEDVWDTDDEEWYTHYYYTVTYRYFVDDEPYTYTRQYEDTSPRKHFTEEETLHVYRDEDGTWHMTEFSSKMMYGMVTVAVSTLVYALIVTIRLRNT